jgi:hypothetical protein
MERQDVSDKSLKKSSKQSVQMVPSQFIRTISGKIIERPLSPTATRYGARRIFFVKGDPRLPKPKRAPRKKAAPKKETVSDNAAE